ncbi:MAG: MFS transporter, partial [Rhodospirillaceae bacterium]
MPQAPQPHSPSTKRTENPTKPDSNPDKQQVERQSIFAVWGTLRLQTFRAFWIAGLFSLIGTWMQGIGSAWLMTDLSDSPLLVALVQSAQMIPSLFLAFIAGSLTDMIDRRRYMIIVTWWMIAVTLSMAGLTQLGMVTPTLLIVLTLLLGIGGACLMPAMSATLQDIVPRSEVVNAVTLNSLSMNISRLIGPALAGLLIGWAGVAPAFVV